MLPYKKVTIDLRLITDTESFHAVFAETLGFPYFYGKNMDAWIDCMTSLDMPSHGMTSVHAPSDGVFVLEFENIDDFKKRCPGLFADLIECSAFVNWRRMEDGGEPPILVLSFCEEST